MNLISNFLCIFHFRMQLYVESSTHTEIWGGTLVAGAQLSCFPLEKGLDEAVSEKMFSVDLK